MSVVAALFLLLAAAPEPTSVLAPDTEARWVPFELTPHNQIRFHLLLDGESVVAILDTGVTDSAMARSPLPTAPSRTTKGTAIGGAVRVDWVDSGTIAFGGLRRTGGRLALVDLPGAVTGEDVPVTMLAGADLTTGYALDIDYPARRFRLLPSGRMPFRGETAPLYAAYRTELRLGGARVRPIGIDTGDGSDLTLSGETWRAYAPATARIAPATMIGLGGPVEVGRSVLPEIGLGTLTARAVETNVEPGRGYAMSIGTAGRIGSGFLRHYRVLLDPGAGHMILSADPVRD